jgi:hypothetical protein
MSAKPKPKPKPKPVEPAKPVLSEEGRRAYYALWCEYHGRKSGKIPTGGAAARAIAGLNESSVIALENMAHHAGFLGVDLTVFVKAGYDMFEAMRHATKDEPNPSFQRLAGPDGIRYYILWEAMGKATWFTCDDGIARPCLPYPVRKKAG